jgi:hypothetical protein
MIKVTEFRIGNYVYEMGVDYSYDTPMVDKDDKTPVQVDLAVLGEILNFDGTTKFKYYKPIPLTTELLEKCGFKLDDFYSLRINRQLWLQYISDKISLGYDSNFGSLPLLLEIKYLHQLQNIYFALTGQELEVNL